MTTARWKWAAVLTALLAVAVVLALNAADFRTAQDTQIDENAQGVEENAVSLAQVRRAATRAAFKAQKSIDVLQGEPGAAGELGLTGLAGLIGKTGAEGPLGATGGKGDDGTDGTDGANGTDGAAGENGTDGTDGTDGVDGQDGIDGVDGATGPMGSPGAPCPNTTVITTIADGQVTVCVP